MSSKRIVNFGRNVDFEVDHFYEPSTEEEILELLRRHSREKVRVVGSKHAWNEGIKSTDVVVSLAKIKHVRVITEDDSNCAVVGGGCQIKAILKTLNQQDLTLPSVGLISQQTIAGATATATHGSGRSSLSHFIKSARIACFDKDTGEAVIRVVNSGDELRAARCAIGGMGIVIEVVIPVVPQYYVTERIRPHNTIEAILDQESTHPLQQFFLVPHSERWLSQERSISRDHARSGWAWLFRLYWFVVIDVLLHLVLKFAVSILRSRTLVHLLMRRVLFRFIFARWVTTDRSDHALIMEHELFRHLELEAFVARSQLVPATNFVREIINASDSVAYQVSESSESIIESTGLSADFEAIRGRFTHHYPICIRRVAPDDTLISPSAQADEDWYALSFITYVQPRDDFYAFARLIGNGLHRKFAGRLHWGKWNPFTAKEIEECFEHVGRFKEVCEDFDPNGVFRNDFLSQKLGDSDRTDST